MNEIQKFRFKIAVIGDREVGKTSLMKKFTEGDFSRDYTKTVGAHFSVFDWELEGVKIRLLFWDLAGGYEFHFLRQNFFRNSRAAIIVCSLEDNELGRESFYHIAEWHNAVVKYCGDIPIYLFANKVDVVNEDELDDTIMKKLVEENNLDGYYYTSVKTNYSVIAAFYDISIRLYKRFKSKKRREKKGRT